MRTKLFIMVLSFSILACGAFGVSTTATPPPAPTDVPAPTNAPAQPTAAETAAQPVFRDDFDRKLADGWLWVREDPANWSLTAQPGSLMINVGSGHVNVEGNSNLLLRDPPAGNFRIETKVDVLPVANFQFAGLILYESAMNFIQAGRAFCEGGPDCIGIGFYMDQYVGGAFAAPNLASPFTADMPVYLRVTREGDTFTFETGTDGANWEIRGSKTSEMDLSQIGLVVGQSTSGIVPAFFDYFEVTPLP